MLVKSELLLGESIRDKSELYDLLKSGKLPLRFYLLCAQKGTLEIVPASMQNNKYVLSDESVVFGIAGSKREAKMMICDIITQVYTEHKYSSVDAYVKEILDDAIC